MDYWKQHDVTAIESAFAELPKAELRPLYTTDENTILIEGNDNGGVSAQDLKPVTDKAVFVKGEHIATVSKDYVLVQHEEAFKPIVEALKEKGVEQFKFTTWANHRKAFLGVTVAEANDTVRFGFKCSNSVDGCGSISYGLSAKRVESFAEIVEKEHVTVWGVRQVCSNGMVIKVPLKSVKYLDVVTRQKVQVLMEEFRNIRHTKGAEERMLEVQYLVEAFLLLREPINRMIFDAQELRLNPKRVKELLGEYVGKRVQQRILLEYYKTDGASLWDLYNAVTYVASHTDDFKDGTRNSLVNKAGDLLTGALLAVEVTV